MTEEHQAAEHHGSAAIYHQQAMRYHREASTHYQIGKDYAHAAHMALVAHGHGWQAINHGNEAGKFHAERGDSSLQGPLETAPRFPATCLEIVGELSTTFACTEHHAAAADHHERAAHHHGEAAKHCNENNYSMAAHEAQLAHGHAQHAIFCSNESAKHHAEHYGRSRPTAELT